MVPAVTEVVLVPELVALDGDELVKAYVVLRHAVLALVEVEGRDEVRRPVVAAGAESVQVTVRPAHHGLDHVVQPGQRQVAGQLEPPPDRWLRSVQVEANAEAAHLGGGRPQRRLGRLQLLEDAGDPPAEKGIEQSPALFGRGARQ